MMMPPATTRALPSGQSLDETVRAEIQTLKANGELGTGYKTQPRCHVCCEVESKDLVNKLLAAGLTNREITEACGGINVRREESGDDRMIRSRNVWVHRTQHFNVDLPVQAAYRSILERRAKEVNRDFEDGECTAVTPYAVLETAMVKGYSHITNEETVVTTKEAVDAAAKFHELTSRDQGQRKMADLLFTMDRLISAAQEFIPVDRHEAFLARVSGAEPMAVLTEAVHQAAEDVVRDFTPITTTAEDEEI